MKEGKITFRHSTNLIINLKIFQGEAPHMKILLLEASRMLGFIWKSVSKYNLS